MLRRPLWPLLAAAVLLALPSAAPAKPGTAKKGPSTNQILPPESNLKVPAPPCGLHDTPPKKLLREGSRRATKTTAKNAIGAIGETITLKATLEADDGERVAFKPVEFKVGGQVIGTAKTNSKGEAAIHYKIPNAFGAKPFTARYAGNSLCKGSTDDGSVGTVRAPTELTVNLPKYANVGSSMQLYGRLKRTTDDTPISGREVEIHVGGAQVATAVTGGGGNFVVNYTPTGGVNTLQVKAHFIGDVLYNPIAKTSSTTLYPPTQTVYLRWSTLSGYYGQTINATVYVNIGAPLSGLKFAGAPVRMWATLGNDSVALGEATSSAAGVAIVPLKLLAKPDSYKLNAHADIPLERYTQDKGGAKINIMKAPLSLTVLGPNTASIGAKVSYTIKAVRLTDNAAAKGVEVCYQNICANTDASGAATLQMTIGSYGGTGPRTLDFTSKQNAYYVAGAKNFVLQVKPSVN